MKRRRIAAVGVLLMALAATVYFWWISGPPSPVASGIAFKAVTFENLSGWEEDDQRLALQAFIRSCTRLEGLPLEHSVGPPEISASAKDWRASCARAREVGDDDPAEARQFFETEFEPVAVMGGGEVEGLFTGYYEPQFDGSRQRIGRFNVPLYGRPKDLVTADLGAFRTEWQGTRIVGRLDGSRLKPFDSRAAIEGGGLADRAEPIVWLRSAIDAFFLHIQGAGRIRLNDGTETRVGYAASNGHPYTAIGRELVARGALAKDDVSMQTIRHWLKANPHEAKDVMLANARYIFFREIGNEGPLGAAQVVLTPGRSLAVDTTLVPLHLPVWLVTSLPPTTREPEGSALRRLLVTQDSGSAIRGPVRGDIFWGNGSLAEEVAGKMSEEGRYYLLLPRGLRERKLSSVAVEN